MDQDSRPATTIPVPSLACRLLEVEFGAGKPVITDALFAFSDAVEELGDGYAFRFCGAEPEMCS